MLLARRSRSRELRRVGFCGRSRPESWLCTSEVNGREIGFLRNDSGRGRDEKHVPPRTLEGFACERNEPGVGFGAHRATPLSVVQGKLDELGLIIPRKSSKDCLVISRGQYVLLLTQSCRTGRGFPRRMGTGESRTPLIERR